LVPKKLLQAKAEAIDLIVPLIPDLMSMIQNKPLDLTEKMIERLCTEK